MVTKRARLVEITGDQEEFGDLLGTNGDLHVVGIGSPHNWYNPDKRGDSLEMVVEKIVEKDGKIKIFTKLGNTFCFRLL